MDADRKKESKRKKMPQVRKWKKMEGALEASQREEEEKKRDCQRNGVHLGGKKEEERSRPTLAALGDKVGQFDMWELLPAGITIDSGAAETVIPANVAAFYRCMPTAASEGGLEYQSATGEPIPNLGEKRLNLLLDDGSQRKMVMQVAAGVTKALGSVSRICSMGHKVVFDDDGSYIEHKATGTVTWLQQRDGVYVLDAWIAPPDEESAMSGFQRQAGHR